MRHRDFTDTRFLCTHAHRRPHFYPAHTTFSYFILFISISHMIFIIYPILFLSTVAFKFCVCTAYFKLCVVIENRVMPGRPRTPFPSRGAPAAGLCACGGPMSNCGASHGRYCLGCACCSARGAAAAVARRRSGATTAVDLGRVCVCSLCGRPPARRRRARPLSTADGGRLLPVGASPRANRTVQTHAGRHARGRASANDCAPRSAGHARRDAAADAVPSPPIAVAHATNHVDPQPASRQQAPHRH